MATVNEKHSRSFSKDYNTNDETHSLTWQVIFEDASYDAEDAKDEANPPSTYRGWPLLSVTASGESEDGCDFTVTAEYGRRETEENPLDEPADIQWGFAQFQKPVQYDINNQPILNSAGDPVTDQEIDDSRLVLTVTRNEASFNPLLAFQYRDAVNATPFKGCPIGTVKVANIGAVEKHDKPDFGVYYTVTYTFHFDPKGFDRIILDQGYREKIDGKMKHILVQGQKITEPHLLDGTGKKLPVDGQPRFKTWRVYPRLPFGVFNF